jgi:hypothetical protein
MKRGSKLKTSLLRGQKLLDLQHDILNLSSEKKSRPKRRTQEPDNQMYDFSKFIKFNARKDYDNNKFQVSCLYESISDFKEPDFAES